MIDYRSHVVALNRFRQTLAAETINDPKLALARDQLLLQVANAPEMACLGSMVDHLLAHASSDGVELGLLERAADLWAVGLNLYQSLGECRTDIENSLSNPGDPASAGQYQQAIQKLHQISDKFASRKGDIGALKADIRKCDHLRQHPRQSDEALPNWSWGDLFLARRTDAFTRILMARANGSSDHALAFGVLSSYGANACGSAYLGQVVGGPRRSHRHRDRLARNTVGSWFAKSNPSVPSLGALAAAIRYGSLGAPTLPASIEKLLTAALSECFDLSVTPELPDLNLGYGRLVRHLELLNSFLLPPPPSPPIEPFLTRLYGDPSQPPPSLAAQVAAASGAGPAKGVTPQTVVPTGKSPGPTDAADPTESRCEAFWTWVGLLLLFILGGHDICMFGYWFQGEECPLWKELNRLGHIAFTPEPGAGAVTSNAAGLTAAAGTDQINELVGALFELQGVLLEGLENAYDYLALFGLIYPDALIDRARYLQFQSIPASGVGLWPHLPESGPLKKFHQFPSSGIEQPGVEMDAYPVGAAPSAFLLGVPGSVVAVPTAASVSTKVWWQIAMEVLDARNLDLDADRGVEHPCWDVNGSITDNPINVVFLNYLKT